MCVFHTSISPSVGCRKVTRAAALFTKKSPWITWCGKPESEYGSAWDSVIGSWENTARPEPKAPLLSALIDDKAAIGGRLGSMVGDEKYRLFLLITMGGQR